MPTIMGNKIQEYRKKMALSLDKLAEKTNLSKSYLWSLEKREDIKPSAENIAIIARELGLTAAYLIDDNAVFDDEIQTQVVFRKYNGLNKEDKEKINDIINLWSEKK